MNFVPVATIINANNSLHSSIRFLVGFPAPCPALRLCLRRSGAWLVLPAAYFNAATNLKECNGTLNISFAIAIGHTLGRRDHSLHKEPLDIGNPSHLGRCDRVTICK